MKKWEVRALLALCSLLAAGCPNKAGVTCPDGQQYCNGACISVTNDLNNCGSCGKTCAAALACIHGSCGCPGSLTNCNDACIDTNADGANCGSCGNACGPGQVCSGGSCQTTCGPGLTECNSACFDTNSNPANCGSCGKVCPANNFCMGGQCVPGCPAPLTACSNNACVDTNNDPNNCGGCGNICTTADMNPIGTICCAGTCVVPDTVDHCGSCAGCPDPVNDSCFVDGAFFCFSEGPG
ncbi:MAG TPA: MXAN_6577-like cysteine-rich protein [Polyangia bacterium]|jgi:hypothetical protein|nr:MXAN_6577-like cysteine-rich protein [Polyangia bacterium]